MKALVPTGKKILVKNVYIGGSYEDVPVMRNGKPTKRIVRKYVSKFGDEEASGYIIEGKEAFILDFELEKIKKILEGKEEKAHFDPEVVLYKENGERLTCECKFGPYGQKNHTEVVWYNVKFGNIFVLTHGYQGPTGKGWGSRICKVNW